MAQMQTMSRAKALDSLTEVMRKIAVIEAELKGARERVKELESKLHTAKAERETVQAHLDRAIQKEI